MGLSGSRGIETFLRTVHHKHQTLSFSTATVSIYLKVEENNGLKRQLQNITGQR